MSYNYNNGGYYNNYNYGASNNYTGYSGTGYGTTNYGATGYQHTPYKWSGYETKFPNSSTLVTFHITLDPRTSLETDKVRITGNLEEMTSWGEGLELVAVPGQPFIRQVSLHLPYSIHDFCHLGMFKYRYEIHDGNNVIKEIAERSEKQIKLHFFNSFVQTYTDKRYRGIAAVTPKKAFQTFILSEFDLLNNNSIGTNLLFERFSNLVDCFPTSHRNHVEELFEDDIDIHNDNSKEWSTKKILIYLALIG